MMHFGVNLIERKYSLHINREEFALIKTKPTLPKLNILVQNHAYTNEDATEYSLEWCEKYRNLCLENYDLTMAYFASLDSQDFEKAIIKFLAKHKKFIQIDNLLSVEGISGYYMMVLDEFKQVYIGKCNNISQRIRQHWTHTRAFDRILFPMYAVARSCFSIDFFRALDTTRIFIWKSKLTEDVERELVADFPKEYCTNRIGGDATNYFEVLGTMNTRNYENLHEESSEYQR